MPRLLICFDCTKKHRLNDYEGDPEHDAELKRFADLHLHPEIDDSVKKGGMLYLMSDADERLLERDPLGNRKELMAATVDAPEMAKDYKQGALVCFVMHGQPSFPGQPCIDFQSDTKRIGMARQGRAKKLAQTYLCQYCPYQVSVAVEVRRRRGAYNDV